MHRIALFLFLIQHFLCHSTFAGGRIGVRLKNDTINDVIHVIVTEVIPGTPAAIAGILKNDIVKSFNGEKVNYTHELVDAIRNRSDTSLVPIVVLRNGSEKRLLVKIYQEKAFTLLVNRDFGLDWIFTSYKIFVNDENIGEISNYDTKYFAATTLHGDSNIVYVRAIDLLNDTSVSYFYWLISTDGYLPVITFTAGDGKIPLSITYKPFDSTVNGQRRRMLSANELDRYKIITDKNSLVPKWFKNATRKSLEGIVSDDLRSRFFAPLIQCPPDLRLLVILLILYPMLCLLNRRKIGYLVLYTIGLYPFAMVAGWLINLAIYGFTGDAAYVPFEFTFFCILGLGIIGYAIYSIFPTFRLVVIGKEEFEEKLGRFGKILAFIEVPLVFIELYKLGKEIFGT